MTKSASEATYSPEAAPMEQVRELLFGAQLKDMELRTQRQEKNFQRDIGDMRDSLKTRIDSLENFMKSEISSLLHRIKEEQDERESTLKTEHRERQEALKSEQRDRQEGLKSEQRERQSAVTQMMKELALATETFERKIAKVSNTLDTAERELRQLLLVESGTLSNKIEEKYQDTLNVIASTASQIRYDMVHRSSLSGMFTEVAIKLSGQWTPEVGNMLMSSNHTTVDVPQGNVADADASGSGNA